MIKSFSTLTGARLFTVGVTIFLHPNKGSIVCMCDLDEYKNSLQGWIRQLWLMACALPRGWKEESRALQEHILISVLHNDFINNLEVATEDTLMNLTDDIKMKGIVGVRKRRSSTEGTETNWGNGPMEPYGNQEEQMPNPRNTRTTDSLHSWSVALGRQKKVYWALCQTVSWHETALNLKADPGLSRQ